MWDWIYCYPVVMVARKLYFTISNVRMNCLAILHYDSLDYLWRGEFEIVNDLGLFGVLELFIGFIEVAWIITKCKFVVFVCLWRSGCEIANDFHLFGVLELFVEFIVMVWIVSKCKFVIFVCLWRGGWEIINDLGFVWCFRIVCRIHLWL